MLVNSTDMKRNKIKKRKLYKRGGRITYYNMGGMYGNNTVPTSMMQTGPQASYEQVNQAQITAGQDQLAQIQANPWQQQFAQQQAQRDQGNQMLNQSLTQGTSQLQNLATKRFEEGKNMFGMDQAGITEAQYGDSSMHSKIFGSDSATKYASGEGMTAGQANLYGQAANLVGQGVTMVSDDDDATTMNVGETSGTILSGAGKGAATGATIGSIIPGVGTAIGAGVGAVVGGISSGLKGKKARDEAREMEKEEEARKAQADQAIFAGNLTGKEYTGSDMGTLRKGGRPGLWANIHAKRKRIAAGSGEKMRKPGSKGAPTNRALKRSQNQDGGYRGYKKTTGKDGKVYYVSKTSPKMEQLDADGNPVSPMEQFTRPGSAMQSIKDIASGNPHIYDAANLTVGTIGRGVKRLTQLGQKFGYEPTESEKKNFNLKNGGYRNFYMGGGPLKYANGGTGQGSNPDPYIMPSADANYINALTGAKEGDQAFQYGTNTMPNLISSDRRIPSNVQNLNLPVQSTQSSEPIDFKQMIVNAPENKRQADLNENLNEVLAERKAQTTAQSTGPLDFLRNLKNTAGEYLDEAQLALATAGMTPAFGFVPDLINAGISAGRGKWGDAALNLGAATPGIGLALGPAAIGAKATKIAKTAKKYKNVAHVPKLKVLDKGNTVLSKRGAYDNLENIIQKNQPLPVVQSSGPSQAGPITDPNNMMMLGYRHGGAKQLDGGVAKALPGGATEFIGKKHEQGGIKLDPMTEVEGGETMDKVQGSDYFFSSYLKLGGKSFAQRHKDILKKGGSQQDIERLAAIQEKAAGRDKYDLGGERKKFANGGINDDIDVIEGQIPGNFIVPQIGASTQSLSSLLAKTRNEDEITELLESILPKGYKVETAFFGEDAMNIYAPDGTKKYFYLGTMGKYSKPEARDRMMSGIKTFISDTGGTGFINDEIEDPLDAPKSEYIQSVIDGTNRDNESPKPSNNNNNNNKPAFTGLYNNVTDADIADYLDEAAAITGLETFDPRNKQHVELLQGNLMNPTEDLRNSNPTYFSGKETDILEGDLGKNKQGVDGKFGIDTLNALREFSELQEETETDPFEVSPGSYDPNIYQFNPNLAPVIDADPNDEYQWTAEAEPEESPTAEEENTKKRSGFLRGLGQAGIPLLGAGLQLLPAYMAFKEKPDYMAEPGRIPETHLDRVRFNAEREQNEGNYRGMGRMIEQAGMGPAGIAAKMASWGKKQAQDVQIGSAEARQNAQIQNQEAAINSQNTRQNIANRMHVNEFNKAADAATKDRKLMAVQNAVQSIAGMGSDYLQYKAQDDLARAIGGQTNVLDNFYTHELDFQNAYPDLVQGTPEYSNAFAGYLKKLSSNTKKERDGGYRSLYGRGGRKMLKKC